VYLKKSDQILVSGIPKKNIKYDYDLNGRRLHPLAPKRKTKNIGMHLVPKTAILKSRKLTPSRSNGRTTIESEMTFQNNKEEDDNLYSTGKLYRELSASKSKI
jgi:hypothetical protein